MWGKVRRKKNENGRKNNDIEPKDRKKRSLSGRR